MYVWCHTYSLDRSLRVVVSWIVGSECFSNSAIPSQMGVEHCTCLRWGWRQHNIAMNDEITIEVAVHMAQIQWMHQHLLTPGTLQDIMNQVHTEPTVWLFIWQGAEQLLTTSDPRTAQTTVGLLPSGRAAALNNRMILQKWRNATLRTNEPTQIANQGIDFISDRNTWECTCPKAGQTREQPLMLRSTLARESSTQTHRYTGSL